jgi:ribonucleoside-diphosphate reductase alpha chain
MAKAKTGSWFIDNPQRGRSNNSALLLRNKTSKKQFNELMQSVKEFGEPGFVWSDSTELIVNPCVEIGMWPVDETTGESGWQACNLSTINCAKVKTVEDFYAACESAAIIGTLQAGFAEFPYLGKASENIISREALLGVSMTGIMEQHEICLDPKVQKKGAEIVKKTNERIAKLIGINKAARTTCVKPEGTSSCILGTSSGIHPHHAKRYIRRVQANKMEPIYQYFKTINPRACEESVWSNNDSDDVVAFCVEVPDGSKIKNQLGAIDLLEYVKSTQQSWVMNGTNPEQCTQKWLTHNVSNTINVKPEEWDAVTDFIYNNRQYFCGVSLLPIAGDKDYAQAPFTTVYLPSEQIQHYGDAAVFVSGLIEVGLSLYEDNLWAACDSLLGVGQKIKGSEKKEYRDRCQRFADRYMNGDLKLLTYCMKDVYNWKEWLDMNREYKEVDYTNVIEEQNNVNPVQEVACAGGSCEII